MKFSGLNRLTFFIFLFLTSSLLFQQSAAIRCHNCVSVKSDGLEDCVPWPNQLISDRNIPTPEVRRVEGRQVEKKKVCLKVKVQAVDGNGDKMKIVLRYKGNPPHGKTDPTQSKQQQSKSECTSAFNQQNFNFAIQHLQTNDKDNVTILHIKICECNDRDFCNGLVGKLRPNSWWTIIIIGSILHPFFYPHC